MEIKQKVILFVCVCHVISISTEDEMRDMQFLYDIPANRSVKGSLGLPIAPRWDGIFGSELLNTLQDATEMEFDSHYWAGTRLDGMTSDLAVPGSRLYAEDLPTVTANTEPPGVHLI